MADRVLAGSGFGACRSVQRNYARWPVSASHLSTVPIVGRSPENREIDSIHSPPAFVKRVHVDVRRVELDAVSDESVDVLLYLCLTFEVLILVFDELVNKGQRYCQGEFLSLAGGHDLDVLSGLGVLFLEARRVDVSFGLQHDLLGVAQGCISDGSRCVIGSVVFSFPLEYVSKGGGSLLQLNLVSDVSIRVDEAQILSQPLFRSINRQFVNWDRIPINIVCSPVSEYHQHRPFHFAATVASFDFSSC